MAYTELKAYSHYSFLRGATPSETLIERALHLGLSGLAIADRGGVYGLPRAFHALKELKRAGTFPAAQIDSFRLISGAEIPIEGNPNEALTMLAQTRRGYGAMCRILTISHRDQPKGEGCLSHEALHAAFKATPFSDEIFLFPEWEEEWWRTRNEPYAPKLKKWEWLNDLENEVLIPLSRHRDGLDHERTQASLMWANFLKAKRIARQNVLMGDRTDKVLQDTLTSIREGVPLEELGVKLKRNAEQRLKSEAEIRALFEDAPELVDLTEMVREQCTFQLSELRYTYPSEWIPAPHTAQTYLEFLCDQGLKRRYPAGASDAVLKQLQYELSLIRELNFADYFLTVYDIVAFARSKKILCQGRGSAANSIVCYVLGVTEIDPIRMSLLFERFISVERGEPPDIDVDFEHDRREEVIQYIYQKYGRDRAAMVSAVVTYQHRSALRDVAKAFSLPVGTLSARKVEKELMKSGVVSPSTAKKIEEVVERLYSYPRHLSIHSGGFTLSSEPIDTIVPIEPATMEGRTIIQWDKQDLDVLGLLKVDVLSLGMLSAIRRALDYVGIGMDQVPADDSLTYDMIGKADTIGVFQIESRAQMSMLPRLKPRNFYDLVIEVAIVRPGPIVGEMVHPFLRRRRGLEKEDYPHPALKEILGRTLGVPIFQEQVMKMAVALAGFTPGEADRLRRAIGAWRSKGSIDEMGKKLMEGLQKAGVPQEFSQRIFAQIHGFSEYGFPESHAASFALLTYVSCYLKCRHPAEFLCALLNSQPMGFYSPHSLIDDAKRHGVKVLPVCVNQSGWDSHMAAPNTVRLGLRFVRKINEDRAKAMLEARRKLGRGFRSYQEFIESANFDSTSLRGLAMSGAMQALRLSPREALFRVLVAQEELFLQTENQGELFPKVQLPEMSLEDQVEQDYQSTGMSARGHPMEFLRARLMYDPRHGKYARISSRVVKAMKHGSRVVIPGISVIVQRPPTAKGTAFATLEDEHGVVDLIFHREFFQKYKDLIRSEAFFWVKGTLQRDGDASHVIVKEIDQIFSDVEIPIAPGAHQKRA